MSFAYVVLLERMGWIGVSIIVCDADGVVHTFICTQNIAQCCCAFFAVVACVITLVTRLHGCRLWHCRKSHCIDAYFHAGQFAGRDRHNAWRQLFSMMGEILFMWLLFHFCSFHFPLFIVTSAQLRCTSCALADLYDRCRDFGHSWYTGLSVMLYVLSRHHLRSAVLCCAVCCAAAAHQLFSSFVFWSCI